jgi:hypothetical protein
LLGKEGRKDVLHGMVHKLNAGSRDYSGVGTYTIYSGTVVRGGDELATGTDPLL